MPRLRNRLRRLELGRLRGEDAFHGRDLVDNVVRQRVVEADDHEGAAADLLPADTHEADVDVVPAEEGADLADPAGSVRVLDEEEVALGRCDIDEEVVDL